MSIELGARLRQVRERGGLSQRALAKCSGISNATISLIESGKLNPSVSVLKRILDGIQMDLSAFFATEASEPEPVVKLHELGDSSVNFVVRPWCSRDDYWDVHWDVTREVKLRFDREGISIPFPQRDVHFFPTQTNGGALPATLEAPTLRSDRTALTGQSEPDAGG